MRAAEETLKTAQTTQAEEEQLRRRLRPAGQAMEAIFTAYATDANEPIIHEASIRVARLAVSGQSVMQNLYNKIVDRNLDVGKLPVATRVRITMLAQLVDFSAAFAFQNAVALPELAARCAAIAELCRKMRLELPPTASEFKALERGAQEGLESTLLGRVEGSLFTILSMPLGAAEHKEMVAFALKISLCATIC